MLYLVQSNIKIMDPDLVKFFLKILNSICLGLLWMGACAIAGIHFGLAYAKPVIYPILFYAGMGITLTLLIIYYYRAWKNGPDAP